MSDNHSEDTPHAVLPTGNHPTHPPRIGIAECPKSSFLSGNLGTSKVFLLAADIVKIRRQARVLITIQQDLMNPVKSILTEQVSDVLTRVKNTLDNEHRRDVRSQK
jgi:hypothetical protein